MKTKLQLRLTVENVQDSVVDINHLIERLFESFQGSATETASLFFDKLQQKLIHRALGPRYRRRKRAKQVPWSCPRCPNNSAFRRRGRRSRQRHITTRVGRILFSLHQVQCRSCGAVFAPILALWQMRLYQRYSHEMLHDLIALSTRMPYSGASDAAKRLLHRPIAHESTLKRWVDRFGACCPIRPPTHWHGGVALADSTRVKAGTMQRGEPIQVVMGADRQSKVPLGLAIGKDWQPLLHDLQERQAKLIVTDGDDFVESAYQKLHLAIPLQRCRWHMAHQGRHFLFRDGVPVKEHKRWLGPAKRILFEDRRDPYTAWKALVQRLYNAGLHQTGSHFRNAADGLWIYRDFKERVPTTTSLVEREMREINRRTDVGVRWSVQGVKNLLNLNIGFRYQTAEWSKLWPFSLNSNQIRLRTSLEYVNS